ncbi:LysR family transcriptional regulator [Amorphoplanes nipponensis]|uniref:LysR family transcriptional regulator n=1 Tax=Actinoplanes nipponensis TaxID=135950 RepID=A0A919MP43_9ACTN|nr:LysR family transcriptional regulator [Actinoplanes nipponensis]GIE51652.1 LysR family transcriptional regulator [Actinoplanes nipponensis]
MQLELRHLKIVCTVAAAGSVSKAASALGIAQPALTAQLNRIEHSVGGKLFVRGSRGTDPTPLGRLVLDRARLLLPAAGALQEEALRLAGHHGDAPLSRYRIGTTGGPVLGGLVHRLLQERPEPEVSTCSSYHVEELAGMLAAGRLDYAVVGVCGDTLPPPAYGLTWRTIAVDAVCALLSEHDALAGRPEIALADLHDRRWAASAGDGCFTDCFVAACARVGFIAVDMLETDVRTGLDLVATGYAVGLCQGTFRPPPDMVRRPLSGAPLQWRHLLGWHPDGSAAAHAPQVLTHAAAAYLDTVHRDPTYAQWLQAHPDLGAPRAGPRCCACGGPDPDGAATVIDQLAPRGRRAERT